MSAFVVEKRTIDRIVTYLQGQKSYALPEVLRGDPDTLGARLWALNAEAVSQRYTKEPEAVPYVHSIVWGTLTETAIALDCYLAQCAEGNVQESALYRALSRVKESVFSEIVSETPAWKAAIKAGMWT
jgi:hypothetical protein